MRTLNQLMLKTPRDVQIRSRDVSVTNVTVKYLLKEKIKVMVFTARCNASTEKVIYDIVIEIYPKDVYDVPSLNMNSFVKCSCPYFLFNCEWALAKVGSSEIDYSDGKPPHIKNPGFVPYLCKHLFRASPLIITAAQKRHKQAVNTVKPANVTKKEPE